VESTTEKQKASFLKQLQFHLRRQWLAGLLVVGPLWMTYVALKFFFRMLDSFFAPIVTHWLHFSVPGLGFILLLAFLYLIGLITTNILGRSIVHFGESVLSRIPVVKNIYYAAKQLFHTLSISRTLGFKRVVFVEYPRPGLFGIGFVTNLIQDERTKKKFEVVFIPTTPNPTSGVSELVPEGELIETNLSVEEGLKMVISGGLVSPKCVTTTERQVRS